MSASVASLPSDFELLNRFVDQHDQNAFTMIVRRHGGMVRGVAHRVLGDPAGADDAFQATFISLARNALTLTQTEQTHDSLSSWLYRVSYNSALQIKRKAKSRRRCETQFASYKHDEEREKEAREEWLPILDEEIGQLPTRFQSPLVLCHLEGRTQQDAADELGLTYATIRRRLQQAKLLLRERLVSRGMPETGALLVVPLLIKAAESSVAPSSVVVQQAIHAAMSQTATTKIAATAAVGGKSLVTKALAAMSSGKTVVACGLTLIGGLSAGLLANSFDWNRVQDGVSARPVPVPDLTVTEVDTTTTAHVSPPQTVFQEKTESLESFTDRFVSPDLNTAPTQMVSLDNPATFGTHELIPVSEPPNLEPIELTAAVEDADAQPALDLQEPVGDEVPTTDKTKPAKSNVVQNVVAVLEDQKRRLHDDHVNSAASRVRVPAGEKVFKGAIDFAGKTYRFYTPEEADKLLERLLQLPAPTEDMEFRAVFHIDGIDHAATDFGQTLDILQRKQFVR